MKRTPRRLLAAAVSITAFVAAPAAHAATPGMKANDRGPTCGAARVCTATIGEGDAAHVVASSRPQATLIASAVGAGTLTVTPGESGLPAAPCGTSCSPRYPKGTRVTVNAVPDAVVPGARFVRWSDYRCPPNRRSCTLTMDGTQYLNAVFAPVFLSILGGSFGPVSVSPPGVVCAFAPDATGSPTPCRIPFELDAITTITRDPAVATEPFEMWVGACSGVATTCAVRMRTDQEVIAGSPPIGAAPGAGQSMRFGYKGPRGGKIIVTGNGKARTCTKTCTLGGFQRDSRIRIRAKGAGSVRFKRWSDIRGNKPSRAIYVGDPTAVRATFTRKRR